ncbi:MAG: flagellar M-ring protein FliF [Firmicutes bacterium]|nr:flagellar M-ring protein FliF [Bacillota bacterium]
MTELWTRLRQQVAAILGSMSRTQRILAGAVSSAVLVGLLMMAWRASNPPYATLFSRLGVADAGEIVSALRDMGVPYRLADGGTTVLVPEDQVYDARLSLAGQGLPRGGVVGFEIFLESALGATDFDRQVRYNMALQGELTRTIRELDGVMDARVHIVLPERRVFRQDQRPATASVFVQLAPGADLRPDQVRAIAHLIARSVEGLQPENVTIVDNRGRVLSDAVRLADGAVLDGAGVAARFDVQRAYEQELALRVQSMLEAVYGPGRAIVRVSAPMNFDMQEEREDRYEPITRSGGLVRSSQVLEEEGLGSGPAVGAAGVDANVPGYVADAPGTQSFSRREEILNFELNRIERVRVQAPGRVERLSVAVWLDAELEPGEARRVEELIAAAVGVDPARGDSVIVDAMPFVAAASVAAPAVEAAPEPGLEPWILAFAAALALLIAWWLLARRRQAGAVVDMTVAEEVAPAAEEGAEGNERRRLRERVAGLVRQNPREVAQLVKIWLAED